MQARPALTEVSLSLQMNLAKGCDCSSCAYHAMDSMNRTSTAATERKENVVTHRQIRMLWCCILHRHCHQYSTQQQMLELVLLK